MIAVDTNILIYAHRQDSPWHRTARSQIQVLAEGPLPWTIFWPSIHEFLANVTNRRIYNTPTPVEQAVTQVEDWLESPSQVALSEIHDYWLFLRTAIVEGQIVGPKVHDAHLAALCRQHGVSEFWTADRDFSRFPALPVRNPLVP